MTHPPIRRMAPHPPQSSSLDKKKLGKPRPKCTTSSARASSSSNFTRFFLPNFFFFSQGQLPDDFPFAAMERDRSICCNGSTEFSSPS